MAEKTKEKETRSVAPWRPFMGVTERETWIGCWTIFLAGEHGHGGPNDGLEPMKWR